MRGGTHKKASRPAVFLDRDGTLIEHIHFLSDPDQVRILPGIALALRRLREAGYALVVVTNQSGVGRGIFPEERLHAVHEEMNRQLAEAGASVDAIYYCTEAPRGDDKTAIEHPDRKPAPGMLLRASADLGLDIGASWMVGDVIIDVLTGINAGCRGSVLVRSGKAISAADLARLDVSYETADDLLAALDLILGAEPGAGMSPDPAGADGNELEGLLR